MTENETTPEVAKKPRKPRLTPKKDATVNIRIFPATKEQYEKTLLSANITMTEHLNHVIREFIRQNSRD